MTHLKAFDQIVSIDKGELTSFIQDGHQYIHQKGSPGWRNSDTEMFPIIGPTNEAGFKVETPRGAAVQDQHGLLRELDYELIDKADDAAVFEKKYKAGTLIKNSKFPNKSPEEELIWPYSFEFRKGYKLLEGSLEITFTVKGKEGMPFMLGYHPAFALQTELPTIEANDKEIKLDEILAVGSRAMQVKDCEGILLIDSRRVRIETEGFGHFMLWSEVQNMVCIEPITFYPYAVKQDNLDSGFMTLGQDAKVFKVRILI